MPDRPFPAVEALIRKVKRVAANQPDAKVILAEMIRMIGATDADPYEVLGVLIEGAAYTLAQHIPPERQPDTAAELLQLLADRLKARGIVPD